MKDSGGDRETGRRKKVRDLLARAASPELSPHLVEGARDLSQQAAKRKAPPQRPASWRSGLGPGSVVADRYRIEAEIGRGGAATVYRAEDAKFNVKVALKVAAATGEAIAEFKTRFQREARISYQLGKAPGIVRALDWGVIEEDRSLYLALDLIHRARALDLREGPLDARLKRLATAASLVNRIHRQGVVHRDVKPGNFLVSEQHKIYLSDFGTARSLRDESPEPTTINSITRTGLLMGTPLFMAPEQFNDPRQVGRAADVYALGVMLYHCLLGRYPYEGNTVVEFLKNQLEARYGLAPRPPQPRDVDSSVAPALDALCMESISLDADLRPPDAGAFLRRLRAHLDGEAPPKPSAPIDLWSRLGLDADAFTTLSALRVTQSRVGRDAFARLLKGVCGVLVKKERAVQGVRHYEGRLALLLGRQEREPQPTVTLGRTEQADVAVRLTSVSTRHLRFLNSGSKWSVVDEGSRNGTTCNGRPLQAGEPRRLSPGDEICLSEHLILEFLPPVELKRRIGSQG
jgi:serine/threonine protein kinase